MARIAVATSVSTGDFTGLRMQPVVHAVGGLLVLFATTAPAVYKPWGQLGNIGAIAGRRVRNEG